MMVWQSSAWVAEGQLLQAGQHLATLDERVYHVAVSPDSVGPAGPLIVTTSFNDS